jgi:hypothetical protein
MRILREVNGKLDGVVTKDMFRAESRRVDERLDEQGRDISDERTARAEAIAGERASRKEETGGIKAELAAFKAEVAAAGDKAKANMRWLAGAIALPIAFFLFDRFGGGS